MAFNEVREIDNLVPVRNALVSVHDKRGLDKFVTGLVIHCPGLVIYSTGGTYDAISGMTGIWPGKNLLQISAYTGQPEMQGGLVKTLDWKIYLGLLSEPHNDSHHADMDRVGAIRFDMVVCNLYPFREVVADPEATSERARQHVDIGGPCMLRASAKNWIRAASVSNPDRYPALIAELKERGGRFTAATRRALAEETFRMTSEYDAAIASFFLRRGEDAMLDDYGMR